MSYLAQVNEPELSVEKQLEDKVLSVVKALGAPTAREVGQRLHASTASVKAILDSLSTCGIIGREIQQRTCRYSCLPGAEDKSTL